MENKTRSAVEHHCFVLQNHPAICKSLNANPGRLISHKASSPCSPRPTHSTFSLTGASHRWYGKTSTAWGTEGEPSSGIKLPFRVTGSEVKKQLVLSANYCFSWSRRPHSDPLSIPNIPHRLYWEHTWSKQDHNIHLMPPHTPTQ